MKDISLKESSRCSAVDGIFVLVGGGVVKVEFTGRSVVESMSSAVDSKIFSKKRSNNSIFMLRIWMKNLQ